MNFDRIREQERSRARIDTIKARFGNMEGSAKNNDNFRYKVEE